MSPLSVTCNYRAPQDLRPKSLLGTKHVDPGAAVFLGSFPVSSCWQVVLWQSQLARSMNGRLGGDGVP